MAAARRGVARKLSFQGKWDRVMEGRDVREAAEARISRIFNDFPAVYLSFSGGKDSGVMYELVANEARRRGRRVGVLIVDLEAQYKLTIEFVHQMLERHADVSDVYWVCLPLALRNAVSYAQPKWQCWDPDQRENWVREFPQHPGVITDERFFPFFRRGMEFEEFVPEFGLWYAAQAGQRLTASFVGIRAGESLNRMRTLAAAHKEMHQGLQWTTWVGETLYSAYPIYDWHTRDIWRFNGKTETPYNRIYDLMAAAGVPLHNARLCQPYGDDQRDGLGLFHVLEPETWGRVIARVDGANFGAIYARETGNVMGRRRIELPDTMPSWRAYTLHLLDCLPPDVAERFWLHFCIFREWYTHKFPETYPDFEIPDDGPPGDKKVPSWRRLALAILKNDYNCTSLSFNANKYQEDRWRHRNRVRMAEKGLTR